MSISEGRLSEGPSFLNGKKSRLGAFEGGEKFAGSPGEGGLGREPRTGSPGGGFTEYGRRSQCWGSRCLADRIVSAGCGFS